MSRRRLAFVAGSNGPSWEAPLRFANTDATRVAQCLQMHCGFTASHAPEAGDAHDVIRTLTRTMAECRPGDDLVVYFSGHGCLHNGKLFLLWDDTTTAIFDSAINARTIVESMEMCAAAHKLLILDCCHAGAAAGFKGTDLHPVLAESGSQLILCASNRLERAREFEDLGGSFLAHHVCLTLQSTTRSSVSLTQLVTDLRTAANSRAGDARSAVPEPFLFGEQRSQFIIKPAAGWGTVQLTVSNLFEPDLDLLDQTLAPYARWNIARVLNSLPVQVTLPDEFSERIDTLATYLRSDTWPTLVNEETKRQVASIATELIPRLTTDLIRAVRVMAAAAVAKDGTVLVRERNLVLGRYISAKVAATFRVLHSMWLKGESEPAWGAQLVELDDVWSNQLVFGLTWISQRSFEWTFWTDADWSPFEKSLRIFIPQSTGRGDRDLEDLTKEDLLQLILPQLLGEENYEGFLYADLNRLMSQDKGHILRGLVHRGEVFIETESHNFPDGNEGTRSRTARIVAEHVVRRLRAMKPEERTHGLMRLVPITDRLDVWPRVVQLLPELKSRRPPSRSH